MNDLVTYELDDVVGTITMDDGKVNALSVAMLGEVHAALDRAEGDGAIVVLTGRAGCFSAGFDLPTMRARDENTVAMLRSAFDLAVRLLTFPKPVVIACSGHAYAMGALLLPCGDSRVGAAGPYRITTNEVLIGITMPRSAIELCRHRLTPRHLHRALALAEVYAPEDAVEAGFLDHVVSPDRLRDTARDVARGFASLDPAAYQATKARLCEDMLPRLQRLIDEEFPR
jgi:enoyl-CoA hydratase